jgi:hypothetical protein
MARKYSHLHVFTLLSTEIMVLFKHTDRGFQSELLVDLPWNGVNSHFLLIQRRWGKRWC